MVFTILLLFFFYALENPVDSFHDFLNAMNTDHFQARAPKSNSHIGAVCYYYENFDSALDRLLFYPIFILFYL